MSTEDRYRRALAASGIGMWDWNLVTGDIFVDPVLKERLGYQAHEFRNHFDDWIRLIHPDDHEATLEQVQGHMRGLTPLYEAEYRMRHRDGNYRWFHTRGSVIRDEHGTAIGMAGTSADITERKLGEEALRKAEALNRRIVESTGDCVKILALDGRLLYINPVGLRVLELADDTDLLNRSFQEFFDGDTRRAAEHAVAYAAAGRRGRFHYLMRTGSGVPKWWDAMITPITDAGGNVVQLLAISRDITERRRKDAFRTGQHQVLEMIATGAPLGAVLDKLARLVEAQTDGMLCTVLLLDEDGKTARHGAAPSLSPEYVKAIDGLTIGPQAGSCGTAMYRAERVIVTDTLTDPLWEPYRDVARRFNLRASWSTPIFSPQRAVLGSLAMYYAEPRAPGEEELWLIETAADMARIAIEQQRAYEALRRSEARNQAMLRAIPDTLFLTTAEGIFQALPAEIAQPLALAMARVMDSEETAQVEYTLGTDEAQRFYEVSITRCDGDKVLCIMRDITARKRAELEADAHRRELAHLSRVAMLGEMSGALAHELSQPLSAVLNNAQAAWILLDGHPLDIDEVRAALDDIIGNTQRAGAVIDRLRALLRKGGAAVRQQVDVNDVAREVLALASGELMSRRVTVSTSFPADLPPVLGDPVQLQQVALNLILNACDAMNGTQTGERRLQLSTDARYGNVELVVSDQGPGIPDGQLERVFEPFVTLREEGLGLGLAISRSIVAAHGGSIRAENNAGGGATFRCRLPIAPAARLTQAG